MYPTGFEYHRPKTIDEAVTLLNKVKDSRVLAGGHSLLPAMKLRVANPSALVDIGLPGINGYAVARAIRASAGGAAILLIAVTGYDTPQDLAASEAAGFDHHFRKPADVDAVLRLLQTGRSRR